MRLLAAIPLLLVFSACDDESSNAQTELVPKESVAEQSAPINSHRFEMVSTDRNEHGERLSAVLGCIGCHKLDLAGEDWSDPDWGVMWTANLTHSAAAFSEHELTAMIAEGKRPDRALMDMPSYLFSALHPDDLAALVGYLKTLPVKGVQHPDPTIGPKLAEEIASGTFKDSVRQVAEMKNKAPPDLGPEHAVARYILRATCAECHGMNLQGRIEPMLDAPPPPNLRIVAAYSAEAFSTLMKTGKPVGDRELKVMGGVSRGRYSRFTDGEVKAVYDYLAELARRGP
ncbi:MAG: cytochrome c [Woeseiaceae bacterium]|nr:cytochrome c [Woeseiaceae bacterium]